MVHVIKGVVAVVQTICDYVHLQIFAKMSPFQEHQHNVSTAWFNQPTPPIVKMFAIDLIHPLMPHVLSGLDGVNKQQCHLMLFLVP